MRILSITGGAANMYCGSCMRDNALAAELISQGHDVILLPLYTPTLTDEPNVSSDKVFFGGISIYLLYHVPRPLFRYIAPRAPEIPMPPSWTVFTYVAVIVFLTGIAAGLAPALESIKVDLAASMKGAGGLLGGSASGSRVRRWLVTAQVALSLVALNLCL